jgi:hypothetical protein
LNDRKPWVSVVLLAVVGVLATAVPVLADARQDIKNAEGVTQIFSLSYNGGSCNGNQRFQITGATSTFRRSSTRRRVSVAHLRAVSGGRKCNGELALGLERTKNLNPTWGCGGRCSNLESEGGGFSVDWPYIQATGSAPGYQVSGSSHAHITNRSGTQLATICSRISLYLGPVGCQ